MQSGVRLSAPANVGDAAASTGCAQNQQAFSVPAAAVRQAGGPNTESWGFTKKRPDGP